MVQSSASQLDVDRVFGVLIDILAFVYDRSLQLRASPVNATTLRKPDMKKTPASVDSRLDFGGNISTFTRVQTKHRDTQ